MQRGARYATADREPLPAPGREVLTELVALHARALLRMPWVQSILVLGVALIAFRSVRPALFLAWGALTIGVEVVRARYAAHLLRPDAATDPETAHAILTVLAGLAGASLGVGAVMLMPQLPILSQAVFGAILIITPAAGVAVAHSSRYMLGAYALTILIPTATTWGLLHRSQFLGTELLALLLWAVLVLVAADAEKLLIRSVAIRHERDRLVRDLEQRNADVRAAMAKAEQSAEARARVLAAASHDLRQPLHALSVYSAVLAAHPAVETLSEVSQNIDQIVRSLGTLLNGLLDLSRLSSGYYVPEREPLALEALVRQVCGEYAQAAAAKGLRLIQALEPVALVGDAVALSRIVRNLVDNAIKYTEAGQVRVSARIERQGPVPTAILSVSDTGKGIASADQSRIFEEFYQVDNPGRDRSRGVGLGLAIVQRLCELIGASITVESALGQGTCFRITLPVPAAPPEPSGAVAAAAAQVPLRGLRIYVVDDETDILRSTGILLRAWGIDALTAGSPAAANRIFEEQGVPDLMIVDLRLGTDEHGAELAVRLQRAYGNFPVLITTGETSSAALLQANEHCYTLLQKPIAPEDLRRAIAGALEPPALDHAAGQNAFGPAS